MIVWGGQGSTYLNTGGRYSLATDSWSPMNTNGAPAGRYEHAAVWTGSELMIWGGVGFGPTYFADGARYDEASDSWKTLSAIGSPTARWLHTAVWTGTEMIVWGGFCGSTYFHQAFRYSLPKNLYLYLRP
jgi:hypothetical protein